MPRDIPMLFTGAMVRAILREIESPGAGKTQTRRIYKAVPISENQPFNTGDRIWVRETWTTGQHCDSIAPRDIPQTQSIGYPADIDSGPWLGKIRPSIHMPRWASRLTLLVTDVRVDTLTQISREDAIAEGLFRAPFATERAKSMGCDWTYGDETLTGSPISAFAHLWDSINFDRGYGWDMNPWVVAITFKPYLCNVDQMEGIA